MKSPNFRFIAENIAGLVVVGEKFFALEIVGVEQTVPCGHAATNGQPSARKCKSPRWDKPKIDKNPLR
jgi:hypothetical protein